LGKKKTIKYAGFSELHRQVDESEGLIWGIWARKKRSNTQVVGKRGVKKCKNEQK